MAAILAAAEYKGSVVKCSSSMFLTLAQTGRIKPKTDIRQYILNH